jgi:hypothetical protein
MRLQGAAELDEFIGIEGVAFDGYTFVRRVLALPCVDGIMRGCALVETAAQQMVECIPDHAGALARPASSVIVRLRMLLRDNTPTVSYAQKY